ncbi:MAG: DUF2179 domain-containing protein [Opitutales bacterium]|nr:DUF2179 domain-containing protein [Opitutales bacterium]
MFAFDFVAWVLVPILIFVAKMVDVSLATVRHILIYKGMKRIVPVLAFVEVTIWLIAITQVMQNLNNLACVLAWSGGFAAGTYAGMWIEEKLALGYQLMRVISDKNSTTLEQALRASDFGVTTVDATGSKGHVRVYLLIFERKRLAELTRILTDMEPVPFYTIEDVKSVEQRPWMKNLTPGTFAFEGDLKRK